MSCYVQMGSHANPPTPREISPWRSGLLVSGEQPTHTSTTVGFAREGELLLSWRGSSSAERRNTRLKNTKQTVIDNKDLNIGQKAK